MTRKLVLLQVALALVCFSATMALAAMNPDTGPGCGLGKVAWSEYRHQKNILPQSLMATTNGTFFRCLYRSEEHTSELQSQSNLVCRLLLEKKKKIISAAHYNTHPQRT